ncbi:unnamed protein product [Debaryomyces tyrocola]|nr:unnamed protein product [Debaryomyces tyrocola]
MERTQVECNTNLI